MSKDGKEALAHTHFIAEGEVTFKALLFVPTAQPNESFHKYGTQTDNIKLYVRRVFITDDFQVANLTCIIFSLSLIYLFIFDIILLVR